MAGNFSITAKFKRWFDDYKRVMSVSYKPSVEELEKSAKIIILAVLIVGTMGLLIAIIISLIITGSLALI
ncbi:MAG: SecE/sec61-gamma family protein translocase subunit [Candidatus Micrarchaeia archaeon]